MIRPNRIRVIIDLVMKDVKPEESYESIYRKMRALAIPVFDIHDYLTRIEMWPGTKELQKECREILKLPSLEQAE